MAAQHARFERACDLAYAYPTTLRCVPATRSCGESETVLHVSVEYPASPEIYHGW